MVTRRRFVGSAAALTGRLVAGNGVAETKGDGAHRSVSPETAQKTLTNSSVEKVARKAQPFPMPQLRLLPTFWVNTVELNRSFLHSLPNDRVVFDFRVTAGQPTDAALLGSCDAFWCYTGTGSEECAKLQESIYCHNRDSLFVYLYIPSKLDWTERGLKLEQRSANPNDDKIILKISGAPQQPPASKPCIPYWATKEISIRIPEVRQGGICFEQAEATNQYSLRFRSKGDGPVHTLVPLNQFMDERYSVHLRNTATS